MIEFKENNVGVLLTTHLPFEDAWAWAEHGYEICSLSFYHRSYVYFVVNYAIGTHD